MPKNIPKTIPDPDVIPQRLRNAYLGIADRCRLSERTVRNAFARKPITWQTAAIIAKALKIDLTHFRIKEDNRGRNKKGKSK